MKLILEAIKSLFRKVESEMNTIPIEGTSKRGTLSVEDGILVVREA